MEHRLIVGVDPGLCTGYAEWDRTLGKFATVTSMSIHRAMAKVLELHHHGYLHKVVFEDARLRRWFGDKSAESLQGAGSIKRDCRIWVDFMGDHKIPYHSIKPAAGSTKWDADRFARLTGWTGKTNEHGRDAGCLVLGMKA